MRIARSQHTLIFQIDQCFSITRILLQARLPQRLRTSHITRLQSVRSLTPGIPIRSAHIKCEGPVTDANILSIRRFCNTNPIRQEQRRYPRFSAPWARIRTLADSMVTEIAKVRSTPKTSKYHDDQQDEQHIPQHMTFAPLLRLLRRWAERACWRKWCRLGRYWLCYWWQWCEGIYRRESGCRYWSDWWQWRERLLDLGWWVCNRR